MRQTRTDAVVYFRKNVMLWYQRNGRSFPWRKVSRTKYELIISEVLLQRTKAEAVAGFYPDFIKRYPSWNALAAAGEHDLRHLMKPLGLWQKRARALRKLSAEMAARRGRFPARREEVARLPGVGQYIASAVMLFCHGKQEALLDVNMERVLRRYFGVENPSDLRSNADIKGLSRRILPRKACKEFNWAVLDFAALVCKPRKPSCGECILSLKCRYS